MSVGAPPFYDNLNGITGEMVQQIMELMPALDETHRKILSYMSLSGHKDGERASIQAIADYIGFKPAAIRNRLKVLVSAGVAEHRMVPFEGCRRPVSLYRLTLPDLGRLQEVGQLLGGAKNRIPTSKLRFDGEIFEPSLKWRKCSRRLRRKTESELSLRYSGRTLYVQDFLS